MKLTSTISKRAHQIARKLRANDTISKYSELLSQGMKKAFQEAKAPKCLEYVAWNKVLNPASYKQYKYLSSFDCVEMNITASQFMKKIDKLDASTAIDAAKEGTKVTFN